MQKAARIIYLIAGILNILSTIPLFIVGIVYLLAGAAVAAGSYTGTLPPEMDPKTFEAVALVVGAILLVYSLLWLIGGILALVARAKVGTGKGIHIVMLVVGVISVDPLLIVPGILALASYGKAN